MRAVKENVPGLLVITDVCLCEYTPHGHCGVLKNNYLDNDASMELLVKTGLSHAQAGADMIAPAAMLDGQIAAAPKSGLERLFKSSHHGVFRQIRFQAV